jgi:NADH:ubiquinone oxidoreductase subunit E
MSTDVVESLLLARPAERSQMIELLQDVQANCGYVSRRAMEAIAERIGVPVIEVYRAASFYKAFSLRPRGKHHVVACMGTACHVRGAARILGEVLDLLGVESGETTSDGLFTVESVNCLGACALGPVVVVDGKYHDHMTPAKLRALIQSLQEEETSAGRH